MVLIMHSFCPWSPFMSRSKGNKCHGRENSLLKPLVDIEMEKLSGAIRSSENEKLDNSLIWNVGGVQSDQDAPEDFLRRALLSYKQLPGESTGSRGQGGSRSRIL